MARDDAFLRFVVQEDIKSFADLPGKILTADALTTGFAFVLRRMLALNGVDENDIEWMSTGGVLQRWQAMMVYRLTTSARWHGRSPRSQYRRR